jgi:hypothetical protein
VKANINKAQQKQDKYYKSSNKYTYAVNDLVLVTNEVMKVGQTKKFVEKFRGPYKITRIIDNDYMLLELATNKSINVHYDRLKPFKQRPTPKQSSKQNSPYNQSNQQRRVASTNKLVKLLLTQPQMKPLACLLQRRKGCDESH